MFSYILILKKFPPPPKNPLPRRVVECRTGIRARQRGYVSGEVRNETIWQSDKEQGSGLRDAELYLWLAVGE